MSKSNTKRVYYLAGTTIIWVIVSLFAAFSVSFANKTILATNTLVYWKSTTPLPDKSGIRSHNLVTFGNKLYVLGGKTGPEISDLSNLVYYTTISINNLSTNASASIWLSTTKPLTLPVYTSSSITWNGKWIFLVGGYEISAQGGGRYTNTTYYAQPDLDGDIKQWYQLNSQTLPTIAQHSCETVKDYLFCMGGKHGSNPISDTYVIKLNSDNGILAGQDWRTAKGLLTPTYRHATVVHQDTIYVIGGYVVENQTRIKTRSIYSGTVVSGTILDWEPIATLPITLSHFSAELNSGWLYIIGGKDEYDNPASDVYRIPIEAIDDPKAWEKIQPLEQASSNHDTAVSEQDVIYLVGGRTEQKPFSSDVFYTPLALLTKSHEPQGQVFCDDTITYTIIPTNNGIRDLSDVFINDIIPFNTRLLAVSGRPVAGPTSWARNGITITVDGINAGSSITWDLNTLPIMYSDQVSFSVQVVPSEVTALFEKVHPLVESATNTQAVLPNWFVAGQTNALKRVTNRLAHADAKGMEDNQGQVLQGHSSSLVSPMQLNPTPSPTPQDTGSGPALGVSLPPTPVPPAPHVTWTQSCTSTHLKVHGRGMSNTMTATLPIPHPDSILGNSMRVQVALKLIEYNKDELTRAAEVIFSSKDSSFRLTAPTSVDDFMAVYELDMPISEAVTVTVVPTDGVRLQTDSLTAYVWRAASKGHNVNGWTDNQAVHWRNSQSTYSRTLSLPPLAESKSVTVQIVLADNDPDGRAVYIEVKAGGITATKELTTPSNGNCLDIHSIVLTDVPTGTTEVTIAIESPSGIGDSFGLLGAVAEAACQITPPPTPTPTATPTPTPQPTPVVVINVAEICENAKWCKKSDPVINTPFLFYLPIILKEADL